MIIACTKPPDYSDVPAIEFVGFSKNVLKQGFDTDDDFTYMTISFTDGDGDLGGDTISTLFFNDLRIDGPSFVEFGAPLVPEQGTGNGISGEFIIEFPTTCCIHFDPDLASFGCNLDFNNLGVFRDTVIYEVYILDRAGNKSNVITTTPLILECDPL